MANIPGLNTADSNPGGAWEILFVDMKFVDRVPLPDADGIIDCNDIVLATGAAFSFVQKTLDSALVSEKEEINDSGSLFRQVIDCQVPKDYGYRQMTFYEMEQQEFLVIARDHSGRTKLFGNFDYAGSVKKKGMRFKRDYDSGKKWADYLGYTLHFYRDAAKAASPVTNAPSLAIDDSMPADTGGNDVDSIVPPAG